ncbi:DUF4157 domain-containing protein [Streptomyces mirabilis]|uniref:eCIS core domain-containing protein n=1 Tax=Streptomyces mirabilis TaxID=68239 RepID=UPI0036968F4C
MSTPSGRILQRCGDRPCDCAHDEKAGTTLRRSAVTPSQDAELPQIVHAVLRSPGQPLAQETRDFFEPRFGRDFSGVRVHADAAAAESARAVQANAYTVGSHIVTRTARPEVLAHELTHVVQQEQAPIVGPLRVGALDEPAEAEAARVAIVVGSTRSVVPSVRAPVHIARQSDPDGSATPAPDVLGGKPIASVPVTFTLVGADPGPPGSEAATDDRDTAIPGYPLSVLGLGGHVLAGGDPLVDGPAAARRILSPEYWTPLIPRRDAIVLDRLLEELPRDLSPRIEAEIAAKAVRGQQLSWTRFGFTEAELMGLPDLIKRMNTEGATSLTRAEMDVVRRAVARHAGPAGASSPGSPLVSYSRPGETAGLSGKQYRVRVEVDRTAAIDLTVPSEFNEFGVLEDVMNKPEFEVVVAGRGNARVTSAQVLEGATQEPAFLLRHSGKIRWAGRIVAVAGLAYSGYRIAHAPAAHRAEVVGEEVGGQIGGFGGTALGAAGCALLGIATSGFGLLLCGLAGGLVLGVGGSALGGAMGRELDSAPERDIVCPSCHALQRAWARREALEPALEFRLTLQERARIADWAEEREARARKSRAVPALTPEELRLLSEWLEVPGGGRSR